MNNNDNVDNRKRCQIHLNFHFLSFVHTSFKKNFFFSSNCAKVQRFNFVLVGLVSREVGRYSGVPTRVISFPERNYFSLFERQSRGRG